MYLYFLLSCIFLFVYYQKYDRIIVEVRIHISELYKYHDFQHCCSLYMHGDQYVFFFDFFSEVVPYISIQLTFVSSNNFEDLICIESTNDTKMTVNGIIVIVQIIWSIQFKSEFDFDRYAYFICNLKIEEIRGSRIEKKKKKHPCLFHFHSQCCELISSVIIFWIV